MAANWNLTDAPFGTICGIRVAPDFDHMADIATNSLSILWVICVKPYQIVDRRGILVVRDNITSPTFVKWYLSKRTGGDVVNPKPSVSSNLKHNWSDITWLLKIYTIKLVQVWRLH